MHYLIEMQPGGTRALAFGLSWHTTLGNHPEKVAAKIAARERASAYTRGGARSTVVGLLRTRKRSELPARRVEIFSAAAVFARAFARGPVALRLNVPGGVWLTAAFDGVVVLGTDRIYPSLQAAQAHLAQLRNTYKGLVVYGDQEGERPMPPNALLEQLDTSTRLLRPRHASVRAPAFAWAGFVCLSAWAILLYFPEQDSKTELPGQGPLTSSQALTASWESAISAWAEKTPDHGGQTLLAILRQIEKVPLAPGRWDLTEVDCWPSTWRCTTRYQRGHLGTNQGLRQHLPESWELHWPNLQQAIAQWSLQPPLPTSNLRLDTLPTRQELSLSWTSTLQGLAPALADLALGEALAVSIEAPTETRADGTTAALPATPAVLAQLPGARDLILNGPMRTFYLLALPPGSTIERLQIRRTPGSSAALAISTLSATLTGKIHVK